MNAFRLSEIVKYASVLVFIVMVFSANSFAAGDAAKGKESYNQICASCHGDTGKGDGAAAAALDPKPRDLSSAEYVSTLSDEHIFKVIKEGGASVGKSALMPAWGGVLTDDKIWDVISYLRADICKCTYTAN
ncbi:MAG: c-type cytochrome [Candidatus Dadabacteria bacterium]|nr:c-type cytochrome [Candidatus Dadabacteria bacterium]